MDIGERSEVLFSLLECSHPSAATLADHMRARDYRSKAILSHQGDGDDRMWLILSGTVQLQALSIEGQATVISSFGPGELVGNSPDQNTNAFDMCAIGPVATLQIDALTLHRLIRECPDLGAGLSRIYAGQLHAVLDRLAARVTLSAMGRCYRELLRLAGSNNVISPPPVVAALALTAQTTRETGSRALSALERRGIIERSEKQLAILSRRMLEELVI